MAKHRGIKVLALGMAMGIGGWLASWQSAQALPSYARQTGMSCNQCHTVFPQLTPFGRSFKASGFTFSTLKKINSPSSEKEAALGLIEYLPLSLMFQAAYTRTDSAQPDTQNNDIQFPQQLSLFLAGEITPRIGSFVQATYSQAEDNLSLDNTEIRFADNLMLGGLPMQYGLYLNNNPTVEDLWNSTPAWGFPYAGPDVAPSPAAAAMIDGGLSQQVAGLGAYGFLNNSFYLAATAYRSAQIGQPSPPDGDSVDTIENVAPYWRLAWQHVWQQNTIEIGTYGLYARLYPSGVIGPTDDYTDIGADFTANFGLGNDLISIHGTAIFEHQKLDATYAAGNSANSSNDLNTYRADAHYIFSGKTDLSLGYFNIEGDTDPGLYGQDPNDPVNSSANGSPDSNGWLGQISYFPWQNVRLSAQYIWYTKFDGGDTNYNGFGRDASDNNTLYVLAWLLW